MKKYLLCLALLFPVMATATKKRLSIYEVQDLITSTIANSKKGIDQLNNRVESFLKNSTNKQIKIFKTKIANWEKSDRPKNYHKIPVTPKIFNLLMFLIRQELNTRRYNCSCPQL